MRKFDTRTVLTNYSDGQPFTTEEPIFGEYLTDSKGNAVLDDKGKPLPKTRAISVTLRWAFAKALDNLSVSTPMAVEEKRRLGRLAEKMWKLPVCPLRDSEIQDINKVIASNMAASIVVAAENFFAPTEVAEEAESEPLKAVFDERELASL